jgi:integrase
VPITAADPDRSPVPPADGAALEPTQIHGLRELDAAGLARVGAAVGRSRSPATLRAYAADWARFTAWCTTAGYLSCPADPLVVADYLTTAADTRTPDGARAYAPATLTRWVAAISAAHLAAGRQPPGRTDVVRATLAGIRRMYADAGERPVQRRAPLLLEDIRAILDTARTDARTWVQKIAERRDSALILLGFAGAFRRSELVTLITADIQIHPSDGLHVRLRRSKTDQTGEGTIKALPYGRSHQTCPVCAYLRWRQVLDAWDDTGRVGVLATLREHPTFDTHLCHYAEAPDDETPGPVFRGIHKTGAIAVRRLSPQAVNPILTRRAAAAGISGDILALLGGHSLRAGFVTQAVRAGADPASVMRQTGHTTDAMVRLYTRERAPLTGNAVTRLGL